MTSKAGAVARLVLRGIIEPRLALHALRERGLSFVVSKLVQSTPDTLNNMLHGIEVRSASETRANLERYYDADLADLREDGDSRYRVQLRSGQTFVIRKRVCMSDMRVIYETFVRGDYDDHPPLAGATVVDVGANLGDTAVYYALRGARVIAYEPSAELFDLAVRNAALNGVEIEFHHAGVGCERATLELAVGPHGASTMSLTMFPGTAAPREPHLSMREPVAIVPLADVLAHAGPVTLLKMDCEGCEFPALLSLSRESLRTVEHVFVEYHGSPEPLLQRFKESRFAVRMREYHFILADRA